MSPKLCAVRDGKADKSRRERPKMRQLNRIAALIACVVIAAGIASSSQAQDYPNKPVKLVVGFIPGSAADITARVLGNQMGKLLGQQFVVENKPGAGSSLAADFGA